MKDYFTKPLTRASLWKEAGIVSAIWIAIIGLLIAYGNHLEKKEKNKDRDSRYFRKYTVIRRKEEDEE